MTTAGKYPANNACSPIPKAQVTIHLLARASPDDVMPVLPLFSAEKLGPALDLMPSWILSTFF